jgi:hypothetical protein
VARTAGIAIGLAAALTIAACTNARPRNQVETKTEADVKAVVQSQADTTAKLVGAALQSPKVKPAACLTRTGKPGEASVVQGTYSIALPEDQHVSAAAKVRESWKAAGWTITKDETTGKAVEVAATTPAKYTIRLSTTQPAIALSLFVQSPCYKLSDA